MVIKTLKLIGCLYWGLAFSGQSLANIPDTGIFEGEYQLTMRAAPTGSVLGVGVERAKWRWDFNTDQAQISGTTLSVGFNYALHDPNNADPEADILLFDRNQDGTITLHYALQIYHPGLGSPMANTSTTFQVTRNNAGLQLTTIDRETAGGADGIPGTQIPNVFPLTVEPDLNGHLFELGKDTDQDGLDDAQEDQLNLDPFNPDTDRDGIPDRTEVGPMLTAPLDTDQDSVIDALEYGDNANNAALASGLKTENQQGLTLAASSGLSLSQITLASMKQAIDNQHNSDDFPQRDSTLGHPGIDYQWGSIGFNVTLDTGTLSGHTVRLRFSETLPESLLVYGYNTQAQYQYELLPEGVWHQSDAHTLSLQLSPDPGWIAFDPETQSYRLTLALAENNLGNVNVDDSGGSLTPWLLPILLVITGVRRRPLYHDTTRSHPT
ncbi:GlyGly-CTERM sorting domain-containing protein [Photobacterium sp. TY1-4]|uniref:GlyGly-CTERM sorting domain-containing protein n=1 Tax=Photobacterium sp. TY1-4 TaxID=2899122 RepID=UPI0021C157EE|nr:GlyGly-CTERM sorting domain-containing protein [Photobacterium sp. TY1-4]UXI03018.1 GlyGly-CTERM sorting domain-containing protein [Photobacterium sp. TY1-4]